MDANLGTCVPAMVLPNGNASRFIALTSLSPRRLGRAVARVEQTGWFVADEYAKVDSWRANADSHGESMG